MDEKRNSVLARYRTCFSTDAGKYVLADMLHHGGYFDNDLKTEGEIAVLNYVKTIVKNLGIFSDPRDEELYVQKLLELPNKE